MPSVRSGINCWVAFHDAIAPRGTAALPPKLEDLQAWSTLFRHEGTFGNYLGYVRTACLLCCVPVDVLSDPAVARAKECIRKRGLFSKRPRLWLRRSQVEQVVTWCEQHKQYRRFGAIVLVDLCIPIAPPIRSRAHDSRKGCWEAIGPLP